MIGCPYGKSNANTFVRARAYRVFPDLVCRDQLRGHPSGPAGGLRHPRDVPLVDPSTLGRKTLYALASLKYCYNAASLDYNIGSPKNRVIREAISPHLYADQDFRKQAVACAKEEGEEREAAWRRTPSWCARARGAYGLHYRRADLLARPWRKE